MTARLTFLSLQRCSPQSALTVHPAEAQTEIKVMHNLEIPGPHTGCSSPPEDPRKSTSREAPNARDRTAVGQ
jgi:hypothetical protein